jgi:hypothetical protein
MSSENRKGAIASNNDAQAQGIGQYSRILETNRGDRNLIRMSRRRLKREGQALRNRAAELIKIAEYLEGQDG